MAEKKLIDPQDVKKNNPNDDEEIIKNNPELPDEPGDKNKDEQEVPEKQADQEHPAAG